MAIPPNAPYGYDMVNIPSNPLSVIVLILEEQILNSVSSNQKMFVIMENNSMDLYKHKLV